jgi:dolichyldiphosphatase
MKASEMKAFSLTHVLYDPHQSPISTMFALITLTPIFLIVSYCTVILCRRELAGILMLVGQLANEAFNFILKKAIKEPRPSECQCSHLIHDVVDLV